MAGMKGSPLASDAQCYSVDLVLLSADAAAPSLYYALKHLLSSLSPLLDRSTAI